MYQRRWVRIAIFCSSILTTNSIFTFADDSWGYALSELPNSVRVQELKGKDPEETFRKLGVQMPAKARCILDPEDTPSYKTGDIFRLHNPGPGIDQLLFIEVKGFMCTATVIFQNRNGNWHLLSILAGAGNHWGGCRYQILAFGKTTYLAVRSYTNYPSTTQGSEVWYNASAPESEPVLNLPVQSRNTYPGRKSIGVVEVISSKIVGMIDGKDGQVVMMDFVFSSYCQKGEFEDGEELFSSRKKIELIRTAENHSFQFGSASEVSETDLRKRVTLFADSLDYWNLNREELRKIADSGNEAQKTCVKNYFAAIDQ